MAPTVVKLIIIRNLDDWLISMYHNPYYLYHETCCFTCFLNREQRSSAHLGHPDQTINYATAKAVNATDEDRTIFEIRYSKLKQYRSYFNKHKNTVIVNLKYLQDKNNCHHFMTELNKKYNLGIRHIIDEIPKHIKTGEMNSKNRKYDTTIGSKTREIINRLKNDNVEEWVDNLTFQMS